MDLRNFETKGRCSCSEHGPVLKKACPIRRCGDGIRKPEPPGRGAGYQRHGSYGRNAQKDAQQEAD